MKTLYLFMLVFLLVPAARTAIIDNFNDGQVSDYITVVMLDNGNTAVHNVAALESVGGKVGVTTTTYYDIEQAVYIKSGYHLEVGQEIQLDFTYNGGNRAMGLFAGIMPTNNARANYITVYAESSTLVYSRGFNGTTEMTVKQLSGAYTRLFIRRDGEYDYVAGVYDGSGNETIIADRNNLVFGGPSDIVIGLYSDIRAAGTIGTADNLAVLPDPVEVISNPSDITTSPSQNATFETVFISQTAPVVEWYRVVAGADLLMDPVQPNIDVQLTYDAQNDRYTSTLLMTDLAAQDSGQYYCQITNDSGIPVVSAAANLTVYGLVAHWTLDQADYTGTHYNEVIGGKDALVESVPVFTIGADQTINGAVEIRPESGWAAVDSGNPLILTGSFTISYWAKRQEQTGGSDNLLVDSEIGTVIEIPDGLRADQTWQHICAVFDGGQCRLYLDGVPAGESNWVIPQGMTAQLNIGSDEIGTEIFNGYLDDIRIYNYAMDDIEVAQLRFDFSGLQSCILSYGSSTDWTGPQGVPDCRIDMYDFTALANQYLESNSQYDISGPSNQPDGIVSLYDFARLASAWLDCGLYPDCP